MKNRSAVLSRILGRETYSMLQYMSDANPWAAGTAREAAARINGMAAEENAVFGRIGKQLQRLRFAPPGGCFPEHFSEYHFLGIGYLLPKLADDQSKQIAALESDLRDLAESEDRGIVESLLDLKRGHGEELKGLRAEHAGVNSASTKR